MSPFETPLLVLSPHLDDAVLSCGRLLARHPGSAVATLFAGRPPAGAPLTGWDADAGFAAGDDVVGTRRAEDAAALAVLAATPHWLPFLDAQYGGAEPPQAIAKLLLRLIARLRPGSVLAPLGLFHSDHARARDAALAARSGAPAPHWLFYADAPYAREPALLAAGLASLTARGVAAARVHEVGAGGGEARRRALACYRSQLRALATRRPRDRGRDHERYWRVVR